MRLPAPDVLRVAAARLALVTRAELAGGPIAIAVSGGADSIYLLCALWADAQLRPRLYALHFNHRVRGAESEADACFVAAFCAALGVPCALGVRARQGASSEADLRADRNAFFAEQRAGLGFRILATAHHVDDVVETMLMRLSRGAGLAGLSAPRVHQDFADGHQRWRPLIAEGVSKQALIAALKEAGIPWREDLTNGQPIAVRNRIRAWLGAGGQAALGVDYARGFTESSRILEQASQALAAWADELGAVVAPEGTMDGRQLKGRPAALVYAALGRYLQSQGLGAASGISLEPLVAALINSTDTQASVLSVVVKIKAGRVAVAVRSESFGANLRPLREGHLATESGLRLDRVEVDEALWVKLSRGDISPEREVILSPSTPSPLAWRGRLPGDRYRPLGAPGEANVSDLLINRKVAAELRDTLPVVVGGDIILWIPGLPPADSVRLAGPCKGALRLTWLKPCLGLNNCP